MRALLVCLAALGLSHCTRAPEGSKYFVFVGEKVSVTAVPPKAGEIRFDEQFVAKYRVIESYHGHYGGKEIEFTAYDHYGAPEFSNYEHVLLYVELHEGRYYHAKYQFSPLFKANNGRWAGPYATNDYDHEYNRHTTIKPEQIDFVEPAEIDISEYEQSDLERFFPKPYFRIEGRRAVAVYGNYVPELFLLKKNGVLKARGDFQ